MALLKTCAAILALALLLQSGCDLWCQHAEQIASANQLADGAVPPCHHAADSESDSKNSHKHESPKDCLHPQAVVDDNAKLHGKVVKADLPATLVSVEIFAFRYSRESASQIAPLGHIALSPLRLANLRI